MQLDEKWLADAAEQLRLAESNNAKRAHPKSLLLFNFQAGECAALADLLESLRWIPVEESLPEDAEGVEVIIGGPGEPARSMASRQKERWVISWNWSKIDFPVTHWRKPVGPLPAPAAKAEPAPVDRPAIPSLANLKNGDEIILKLYGGMHRTYFVPAYYKGMDEVTGKHRYIRTVGGEADYCDASQILGVPLSK